MLFLVSRTRLLVRILDDSPKRPTLTTFYLVYTDRNGILVLHREYATGGPEDSIGVDEVEYAVPSGPHPRRRLQSLRRRRRSGIANGIASGKTSGERYVGCAKSATAP